MKTLFAFAILCVSLAAANETLLKFIQCGACIAKATAATTSADACKGEAKEAFGGKCKDACAPGLGEADAANLAQIVCTFDDWSAAMAVMEPCYKCTEAAGYEGTFKECQDKRQKTCGEKCKTTGGFLAYHVNVEVAAGCEAADPKKVACYQHIEGQTLYGLTDLRAGKAIDCEKDVAAPYKEACGDVTDYEAEQNAIMEICKAMQ